MCCEFARRSDVDLDVHPCAALVTHLQTCAESIFYCHPTTYEYSTNPKYLSHISQLGIRVMSTYHPLRSCAVHTSGRRRTKEALGGASGLAKHATHNTWVVVVVALASLPLDCHTTRPQPPQSSPTVVSHCRITMEI